MLIGQFRKDNWLKGKSVMRSQVRCEVRRARDQEEASHGWRGTVLPENLTPNLTPKCQ